MDERYLKQKQILPLSAKINISKRRIREFYNHYDGNVYCGFSGGVDSLVLLHLIRSECPDVEGVFVDTGLEFPENKEVVNNTNNVRVLKPKMTFFQVWAKYGIPFPTKQQSHYIYQCQTGKSEKLKKRLMTGFMADGTKTQFKISNKWKWLVKSDIKCSDKCCDVLKKRPIKKYEKETGNKPFIGVLAEDSSQRKFSYLRYGCNSFEGFERSTPLGFWTKKDIWDYIKKYNLDYSKVYDSGIENTGCMFCMFGVHLEKGENRIQCLKKSHPKYYSVFVNKIGSETLDKMGINYK